MNLSCDITKFLSHLSIERSCCASTNHDYNKELLRLAYFLENNTDNLNSVTTSLLREYLYFAKQSRRLSQTSISKVIAIIKSFFNYLEEEEVIPKNPTRKIKVPKKINQNIYMLLRMSIIFFLKILIKITKNDQIISPTLKTLFNFSSKN